MRTPENPRREPRQARSRALVEAIVEAAARVFDEHGYEATTTNRIAEVAGVSIGSLYQYFPSKEALVTALHEDHARRMLAVVDATTTRANGLPLREWIATLVDGALRLHREQPGLMRILHVELPTLRRGREVSAASRGIAERTHALLELYREQIRHVDVGLATYTVLRVFEELVHEAVLDPPRAADDAAIARTITDALFGYLTVAA